MPSRRAKTFQAVSEAELKVLELLWSAGPSTPNRLQEALSGEGTEWAYTTVQTLLHRLLRKGYVSRKRSGVAQVYRAAVDREALLAEHVDDLARRLCKGAASPLLLSFVRAKRLSAREIARLRQLLDEAEKQKKER